MSEPEHDGMAYYAVRTFEDCEQAVAGLLHRKKSFPVVFTEMVDAPRGSAMLRPIFPGYVWLGLFEAPDWPAIRQVWGVVGLLAATSGGRPYRFLEDEMEQLYRIQAELRHEYRRDQAAAAAQRAAQSRQRRRRPRRSHKLHRDDARLWAESLAAMPLAAGALMEAA